MVFISHMAMILQPVGKGAFYLTKEI